MHPAAAESTVLLLGAGGLGSGILQSLVGLAVGRVIRRPRSAGHAGTCRHRAALVVYGVPSTLRIAHRSSDAISADGLLSLAGVGGSVALALCFGPLGWTLWGVAKNAARVSRNIVRPAPRG